MRSPSQSQPSGARVPIARAAPKVEPSASCDLCDWPMAVPVAPGGMILGLLKCSQCIEDDLAARELEAQP